jgi:hypothetical protein
MYTHFIGLDQVVTGDTGLVILGSEGAILHDSLLPGSNGNYRAAADLIMEAIYGWWQGKPLGRAAVQAEAVYYYRNPHTFSLLQSLLVLLEERCVEGSLLDWLPPVATKAIDYEFELVEYKAFKGRKRRDERKKEMGRKVEEIWGKKFGDDRDDAALHALYALRKVSKLVLLEES